MDILPRLSLMNNLVFCTFSFVNSSTLICYKLGIFIVQFNNYCTSVYYFCSYWTTSTTISLLKCIDVPTLHQKHSLLFFPCHKFPAPFENVLSSKQHLIKYICLYFSQNIHFMQFVIRYRVIVCDIISLQDIQGNFQ